MYGNCPTRVSDGGLFPVLPYSSHYSIEQHQDEVIERMYLLPWSIDSYWAKKISRIYKVAKTDKDKTSWIFVKELPILHSDNQSNLLKRVTNLLPFL